MTRLHIISCILITFILMACDSLTTTSAPNQIETQAIGEALAAEIEDAAEGFNLNGAITLNNRTSELNTQVSACLNITVLDPSDTDNDGRAREVEISFDCSGTGWLGGTASLTGKVTFLDPLEEDTLGYDASINNLKLALVNAEGNRSYTETRNGTAIRRLTTNKFTESRNITTVRDYKGVFVTALVNISNKWDISFTPEAGSNIVLFEPLPGGKFDASGLTTWTGENGAYTLDLSTPEGLEYDAECNQTPGIVEGRIEATLVGDRNNRITIQYNGCGVKPTITLVSQEGS